MLKVIQFEYGTEKTGNRKANILCKNSNDAIEFLKKLYNPKTNKITGISNIGMSMDIHGVTDSSLEYIQKRAGTIEPAENKQSEIGQQWICPWCKKTFETDKALVGHISKSHIKKEKENEPGEAEKTV